MHALYDCPVGLASVLEDVCLYLVVAYVGIVVQRFQLFLGPLVILYVFGHALLCLSIVVSYVDSKRQAYIVIHLGAVVEASGGHLAQTCHKTVVASNLDVHLVYILAEGQGGLLEVLILVGCLVTCVC